MLHELEELASDIWPDPELEGQKGSAPPEWMTNWRSGMEGVDGL
jgi:hypothetical protein